MERAVERPKEVFSVHKFKIVEKDGSLNLITLFVLRSHNASDGFDDTTAPLNNKTPNRLFIIVIYAHKKYCLYMFSQQVLQSVDKLGILTICEIQPFLVFQFDV
jgi:hypothetical protein